MGTMLVQPERRPARQHPRYRYDGHILVSYRQDERQRLLHGRCNTISEGGVGATVDGHLQPDQVVNIQFSVEKAPVQVRINARVRYNAGFNHGFEFIAPNPTYLQAIRNSLHRQAARASA